MHVVAPRDGQVLAGWLREGEFDLVVGGAHGGVVVVDRVFDAQQLQAGSGFNAQVEPVGLTEFEEIGEFGGVDGFQTGTVEDVVNGPFEAGQIDQELSPVTGSGVGVRVGVVGTGFIEVGDEVLTEVLQGVGLRWIALQVAKAEAVKNFFAEGAFENREDFAQAVEQACVVGIGVDRQAVGGVEFARARDHALQISGAGIDELLCGLAVSAFEHAVRMGDHGLHPALNTLELRGCRACGVGGV